MEERVTSSENQLEIEPDWVRRTCIGQNGNNLTSIFRHFESDNYRGSNPHELTSRYPLHGENLNGEPVLQSASANQKEATCTSPNTQQGRSISSKVGIVNATIRTELN